MIGVLQMLALLAISVNGIELGSDELHLNSERILLAFVIPAVLMAIAFGRRPYFTLPSWQSLGWVFAVFLSASISSRFSSHVNGLLIGTAPFFYFPLFMQAGVKPETLARASEITLWWLSLGSIMVFALWLKQFFTPLLGAPPLTVKCEVPSVDRVKD
jgi:hypothetical protein